CCGWLAAGCLSVTIAAFVTASYAHSYLKRLRIEEIKIDRSFVMQMHVDANDFMIVRATVDLGRNLGLRVVAEGVEDLATFDRLAELGCEEAQGDSFARLLSTVDFRARISGLTTHREGSRQTAL